jgi:mRNA-degrading endonuclease YafQ of YafQ-DinJ toxin-antitoxin module
MVLIQQNPAAPSLRTHGLKGAFAGCTASRLSREYRIVFVLEADRVTFIDIGTHDDDYR